MATRQALFRFDAGLLFLVAGLALCAVAVLLPAQRDLHGLRQQLHELRRQDQRLQARLRVTADVIRELDRGDPDLRRRLVSSQLNLAPAGDTPIVLVTSRQQEIGEWIADRVRADPSTILHTDPPDWPDTILNRLANGPYRLWVLGGSVMCVFIGLMHGSSGTARRRIDETSHLDAEPTERDATMPILHAPIDELDAMPGENHIGGATSVHREIAVGVEDDDSVDESSPNDETPRPRTRCNQDIPESLFDERADQCDDPDGR